MTTRVLEETVGGLQGMANALSDAVAVIDRDGVIRLVNTAWVRFCLDNGGTLAAVGPSVSYLDACGGPGLPEGRETRAGIEAVLRGEVPRFHVDYPCHAPQRQQWFRMTVTPLPGGALITHTDITGEYERATRWLEHAPVAIIELDADDNATFVNRWWAEVSGVAPSAVLGERWSSSIDPADRDLLRDEVALSRLTSTTRDLVVGVGDGPVVRRLRFTVTPHVDAFGRVESIGLTGFDVTVEDELTRQRAVIQERRRLEREIHDTVIQQLFTAGMLLTEIASGSAGSAVPPPDELELVGQILDASVAQLRSLTVPGAARTPLELEAAIQVVVDRVGRSLPETPRLRIEGSLPPAESEVAAELLAVLTEGLTNVIRHASATTCRIGVRTGEGRLVLTIRDDGVGMPSEHERRSGTRNIADRASDLDGTASWELPPDGGTLLTWSVPLPVEDQAERIVQRSK